MSQICLVRVAVFADSAFNMQLLDALKTMIRRPKVATITKKVECNTPIPALPSTPTIEVTPPSTPCTLPTMCTARRTIRQIWPSPQLLHPPPPEQKLQWAQTEALKIFHSQDFKRASKVQQAEFREGYKKAFGVDPEAGNGRGGGLMRWVLSRILQVIIWTVGVWWLGREFGRAWGRG